MADGFGKETGKPPSPRQIERMEQEQNALVLWRENPKVSVIAEQMGVSTATVRVMVNRALQRWGRQAAQDADALRGEMDQRLVAIQERLIPMVHSGDLNAVDRELRIIEARRKLWGLDLQPQVEAAGLSVEINLPDWAQPPRPADVTVEAEG